MANTDLLVFDYEKLDERSIHLFDQLKRSEVLRAEFISNPAGVLGREVLQGRKLTSPLEIDQANRLLFSLLSNPRFWVWAGRYQRRIWAELRRANIKGRTPAEVKRLALLILSKRRIYHDLAVGMREFGDAELYRALIPADGVYQNIGSITYDGPDPGPTALLVTNVAIFVQVAIFIDAYFVNHTQATTDAPAQGVTHADVFLVNDHVLFTVHDFFFSHDAAGSNSQTSNEGIEAEGTESAITIATESGSEGLPEGFVESSSEGTDVAVEVGSEGTDTSSEGSAASSEGSAASSEGSAASSEGLAASSEGSAASSEGSAASTEGAGAGSEGSFGGAVFGLSRADLQALAEVIAAQITVYASAVRESGALLSEGSLTDALRGASAPAGLSEGGEAVP